MGTKSPQLENVIIFDELEKSLGQYILISEGSEKQLTPEESEEWLKGCFGSSLAGIYTTKDAPDAPFKYRHKFLEYLKTLDANVQQDLKKPVALEELLGTKGLKLYKKALKEEAESKAFREAVAIRSSRKLKGPKWQKRLILWVGGPSASGKSFATSNILNKLIDFAPLGKKGDNSGNYVLTIDGGVEREVSQMRKLALQIALAKGYKGIVDLHEHSRDLSVKNDLLKAGMDSPELSLTIPETFTTGNAQSIMKRAALDDNTVQVFAQIKHQKGHFDRFKNAVRRMGGMRAWYTKKDKIGKFSEIDLNAKPVCESKIYEGKYFWAGKLATKWERRKLRKIDRQAYYLNATNDLMYVHKVGDKWLECNNKTNGVMISARVFEDYNKYLKNKIMPDNYPQNRLSIKEINASPPMELRDWHKKLQDDDLLEQSIGEPKQYKGVTLAPSITGPEEQRLGKAASAPLLSGHPYKKQTVTAHHDTTWVDTVSALAGNELVTESSQNKVLFKFNNQQAFSVEFSATRGYSFTAENEQAQSYLATTAKKLMNNNKIAILDPGDDFEHAVKEYVKAGIPQDKLYVEAGDKLVTLSEYQRKRAQMAAPVA